MKYVIADQRYKPEIAHFVAQTQGHANEWGAHTAVGLAQGNDIIAGVVYDQFNGANVCMHLGAEPGSRWMTREYLWYCFYYPFIEMRVKRVTGLVPSKNLAAQRLDEHLGFTMEAILQDAHPQGHMLVYRMFKQDCRWLNIRKNNGQSIRTTPA